MILTEQATTTGVAPSSEHPVYPSSDLKLSNILEEMADGFVALDRSWNFTYLNRRAEAIVGRSRADLLGKNMWESFPALVGTPVQEHYERAVRENLAVDFVTFYAPLDLWVEARAAPTSDGLTIFFRDVNERIHVEEDLRRNREMLQAMLRSFPKGSISVLDRDGRYLFSDGQELAKIGLSSEGLTGKLYSEAIPGDIYRQVLPFHQMAFVGQESAFDLAAYGKVYDVHVAPLSHPSGGVEAIISIAQDITDRTKNEAALRESEARFRSAFDDAAIAMGIADLDGRLVRLNAAYSRLTGYSSSELLSMSVADIIDAEDMPEYLTRRDAALQTKGATYRMELRFVHKTGKRIWVDLSGSVVWDDDGSPLYTLAQMPDITERRRVEEELRASSRSLHASEERFRALTEFSSDVITILSADGTILYDSPSVEPILGYLPEEMVGRNGFGLIHPDDTARVLQTIQDLITGGKTPGSLLYRYRHKNGSWRWLETTGSNQLNNPVIAGIVANSRDVTERVVLQEQIIQTEKLAALGELVAGVAHEINNPLAAIGGYAQLLAMNDNPEVQEEGSRIQELVLRMTRIVRSLRTFARPTSGDTRKVGQINDVVGTALDVIGYTLRAANIQFSIDLADNLPPVLINRGQIEQVLVNLIGNAEHVLRGNDVDNRQITITTRRGGMSCFLAVRDNGCGMSETLRRRIFDPFFTTKEVGEGTGLGLYISHGIISAHGGRISVESREGEGSVFTVELPAMEGNPE